MLKKEKIQNKIKHCLEIKTIKLKIKKKKSFFFLFLDEATDLGCGAIAIGGSRSTFGASVATGGTAGSDYLARDAATPDIATNGEAIFSMTRRMETWADARMGGSVMSQTRSSETCR